MATVFAVILVTATSVVAFGGNNSIFFRAGESFFAAKSDKSNDILATYKGTPVTRAVIENHKSNNTMMIDPLGENATDIDFVNRVITSMILLEEAEGKGLIATQEEIDQTVSSAKSSYEFPECAQIIDDFCIGAELTLDEYYASIEAQAPNSIALRKLRNQFDEEYCQENGLVRNNLSPDNYAEIAAAYQAYRDELLAAHTEDIVYYID